MTIPLTTSLTAAVDAAARQAGLSVLSAEAGTDLHGKPTAKFRLGLDTTAANVNTLQLQLSDTLDFNQQDLLPAMTQHLAEEAKRLRNPRPDCYVTLEGLPISFGELAWPFHRSTSGSDTYIVHGVVRLEDGTGTPLHAKISASMTVTFAEIVPAPEQPYAETFIYNAVRKTLDQGQLEMLKSGNRQPVPVTTRYYSRWQKKFFFSDSDEKSRREYLALKVYWLSGVLGAGQPVWIADPRDAQYLNTSAEELIKMAKDYAKDGLLELSSESEFATATATLLERGEEYRAKLAAALQLTKPTFNEEMRHGHTNM